MQRRIATDVVVVGGGPSGVCAAIAAARAGATVMLVEEDSLLGGAAVDYGVQSFCGGPVSGIHKELRDRLARIEPHFAQTSTFHSHWWAYVCQEMVAKTRGLTLMLNTRAVGALVSKGRGGRPRVRGVRVQSQTPGGWQEFAITAHVVVDCSGDADIAADAGCEFRYGREARAEHDEPHAVEQADARVQLVTLMYIATRIDPKSDYKPSWCYMGYGDYLVWGPTLECEDTTDDSKLQATQLAALRRLRRTATHLVKHGFAITAVAPRIGVRESRRVIGEYLLTENDLVQGRIHDDRIAIARYPIDPWEPDRKNPFFSVPLYGIPYGCIVPKGVDGLLVAGRCISGTHIAMSSYRVMPIVSSIGQAAGVAAALACLHRTQPRNLEVTDIQHTLRRSPQRLRLEP